MLVMCLSVRPADSEGLLAFAGQGAAWQRQPAPLSGPAGGSEPPESPVWAGPPVPAVPQQAVPDSVRSADCYLPANEDKERLASDIQLIWSGAVWTDYMCVLKRQNEDQH